MSKTAPAAKALRALCPARLVKLVGYGDVSDWPSKKIVALTEQYPDAAHDWQEWCGDDRYRRCRWCEQVIAKQGAGGIA